MYNKQGFTLIELLLVLTIIGIQAVLATVAYQTYTVRKQVSAGLASASSAQTLIEAAYRNLGTAPASRIDAGLNSQSRETGSPYLQSLNIINGRIDLHYGGTKAHAAIVGKSLSLTPYQLADQSIVWRCGKSVVSRNATTLTGAAAHTAPTVESRYLPSECR